MAEEGQAQIPIEPEDPEFEVEEHVRFRRKQEVLNANLSKLIQCSLSQFKQTMDGTSYAYTQLSLKNQGIWEITDVIEQYSQLRNIDLSLNAIKEIPNVLNLKFVTTLNLARNQIVSINFLSRESVFPYLKSVNLLGNKVASLPSIHLNNLRAINLNYNQIASLEEFDGHPLLEILELRGNKLKSLKGLAKLPCLRELYLAENELDSFKEIKQCPKLEKLHSRKNKVSQIGDFPELNSLLYLNLRQNAVGKVADLEGVSSSVKVLNLLGTPLEAEMADNVKKEVWMKFRHYEKINKNEVSSEEKEEFDKEYKERLAEEERARLEKQAAEKEAQENPDA